MKITILVLLSMVFLNAINLNKQQTNITDVNNTTATIKIGDLKIGQSGIVVHRFDNKRSIILTNAIVVSSDKNSSKIKFIQSDILHQDALPTTTLIPKDKDLFVLNHLYDTSLLIVPNYEAQQKIIKLYPTNNFIDIDIFASELKMQNSPLPTKSQIVKFAKHNNLGTIFIDISNRLYILDVLTFKVIDIKDLDIKDKKIQVPFFTNVQDIKISMWNWFGEEKIKDYDRYYGKLIGIKDDRK